MYQIFLHSKAFVYHHGYSRKELAQMLEMSYVAVQQLIWRAKDALRKQLEGGSDK